MTATDPPQQETYSPWTVVNVVFEHLVDQGLHPTFGQAGDPGAPAAALLTALGLVPNLAGDARTYEARQQKLADLRSALMGEP